MINSSLKEKMLDQVFYQMYKSICEIYHPHSIDFSGKSILERIEEVIKSFYVSVCLTNRMEHTLENINFMLDSSNLVTSGDAQYFMVLCNTIKIQYENFCETVKLTTNVVSTALDRLSKANQFDSEAVEAIRHFEYHYRSIFSLYEQFLYEEDKLVPITMKFWEVTLTDHAHYKFGQQFYFVAHATRSGAEELVHHTYSRNLISASILSNIHTNTYGSREYGLIYAPCFENVFLMSKGDAYCDDLPIGTYYIGVEYVCKGAEFSSIGYTDPNACRTYLIEQLENDHPEKFNEIVLLNNAHSRPTAVFRFEPCSEWAEEQSEKASQMMNLNIIVLPKAEES